MLDDGILRVYDLSTFKVIKAVRNMGCEISSIICVKRPGSDLRDAWIAAGTKVRHYLLDYQIAHDRQIMKFQLDSPKMIQEADDALEVIDLVTKPDDVVNEVRPR